MVSLFFQAHRITECVRVFQKSPIKFKQSKITLCQNYSEERVVRSILENHSRLWSFWKKVKGLQENLRLYLLYSWEYLPFSLVSPGCCILSVCALTGVYKRKGGPHSSHYFAFSKKIVDNICVWRWKYYLCSDQEFNQKKIFCFNIFNFLTNIQAKQIVVLRENTHNNISQTQNFWVK